MVGVGARQHQGAGADFGEAAGALQVGLNADVVAVVIQPGAAGVDPHLPAAEATQEVAFVGGGPQHTAVQRDGPGAILFLHNAGFQGAPGAGGAAQAQGARAGRRGAQDHRAGGGQGAVFNGQLAAAFEAHHYAIGAVPVCRVAGHPDPAVGAGRATDSAALAAHRAVVDVHGAAALGTDDQRAGVLPAGIVAVHHHGAVTVRKTAHEGIEVGDRAAGTDVQGAGAGAAHHQIAAVLPARLVAAYRHHAIGAGERADITHRVGDRAAGADGHLPLAVVGDGERAGVFP